MNDALDAPRPASSPWQRLYEGAHRRRERWYRSRRATLPRPVVSIGNVHWGGTGKTPLVAAVAQHLSTAGYRIGILSRGYGRRSRGPLVVATGDGPRVGPAEAGDEPYWLAQLGGVAVAVGERRAEAGRLLLDAWSPDLFLLDDGFSHLALRRDLDLVVLPLHDPWGGGRLPPSGRLREPLSSLSRADAVVVTGGPTTSACDRIGGGLLRFGFAGPVFGCAGETVLEPGGPGIAEGGRGLLVTGVANPHRVAEAASRSAVEIVGHLVFPDHHRYPKRSLTRIDVTARRLGATLVLTTGKDRGKLEGRLDLPLVELGFAAVPDPELLRWLDDRVVSLVAGTA